MQAANRLSQVLCSSSKGVAFGAWQMLPGTNLSRMMARSGVDWICVDMEHGNIDDAAMHEAVGAIAACGVSPIVRVAANEGWMVKRALDAGAHGIIVPLLRTADEAERLVQSAKFPPWGIRGYGSPFSMGAFGNETSTEYLQQANDSLVTVVQIETKDALNNVDAIAKVPGIDVLLIGPFDLGNNIGHPILNGIIKDELKEAIAKIHRAAVENNKRTGIYCTSGKQAREYADQGYHMISVTGDTIVIPEGIASALSAAKGGYMHSALNLAKAGASKLAGSSEN